MAQSQGVVRRAFSRPLCAPFATPSLPLKAIRHKKSHRTSTRRPHLLLVGAYFAASADAVSVSARLGRTQPGRAKWQV